MRKPKSAIIDGDMVQLFTALDRSQKQKIAEAVEMQVGDIQQIVEQLSVVH
jgi:hypothetical protein